MRLVDALSTAHVQMASATEAWLGPREPNEQENTHIFTQRVGDSGVGRTAIQAALGPS